MPFVIFRKENNAYCNVHLNNIYLNLKKTHFLISLLITYTANILY